MVGRGIRICASRIGEASLPAILGPLPSHAEKLALRVLSGHESIHPLVMQSVPSAERIRLKVQDAWGMCG